MRCCEGVASVSIAILNSLSVCVLQEQIAQLYNLRVTAHLINTDLAVKKSRRDATSAQGKDVSKLEEEISSVSIALRFFISSLTLFSVYIPSSPLEVAAQLK